jgi:hypothetical protein
MWTDKAAYAEVGVRYGAGWDEIKRAYHEKIKQLHPDLGPQNEDAAARLNSARDHLRGRVPGGRRNGSGGSSGGNGGDGGNGFGNGFGGFDGFGFHDGRDAGPDPNAPDPRDAVAFVRRFMAEHQLAFLFDGSVERIDSRRFWTFETVNEAFDVEDWTFEGLVDAVVLDAHRKRFKGGPGVIGRAVRAVHKVDKRDRRKTVMTPLVKAQLSAAQRDEAERQWQHLVATAFEMPVALGVATLKKFVHQVKNKSSRRPVTRHLMPVIQGEVQGSGKTTFVLAFLGPLKDLRTEPALLADFVDRRSGDVYDYLAVFVDDVDGINPALIPTLNSLVTGEGLSRRRLGTSRVARYQQRSTLIGTCNQPLARLIPDETGNRRFCNMPFRSGEVDKGGDARVWPVVDKTDYELLWKSVDAFGPDPIEPVLRELFAWQERYRTLDTVEAWLAGLDPRSAAVQEVLTKSGIKANDLYGLFQRLTGNGSMSGKVFGNKVLDLIAKGVGPFLQREHRRDADYYVLRR